MSGFKRCYFYPPSQLSRSFTMSSFSFGSRHPSSSPSPSLEDSDIVIDPSLTNESPSISAQTVSASPTVFRPDPQASLFIDTLGQRFHLSKQQMSDLHGLFQVHLYFITFTPNTDLIHRNSWLSLFQAVLIKQTS